MFHRAGCPHLTTDTQGGISMVRLPTSEDSGPKCGNGYCWG